MTDYSMVAPKIMLNSGLYFDIQYPHNSVITFNDIAHSLSNLCRFNGHCNKFYSVAQHSVLVSGLVADEFKAVALMHDMAEAVTGEITTPMKVLVPEFEDIQMTVHIELCRKFNLPEEIPQEVQLADLIMLATEKRDLMPEGNLIWEIIKNINPMSEIISPLTPFYAKQQFCRAAKNYGII